MNYISHYFLDAKPGSPYFNFGLVLPDMLGSAARGFKSQHIQFEPGSHADLSAGIVKHHEADAYFHNSLFFQDKTVEIRKIFESNGFRQEGTKLFFAAHIFLEFMLDRLILKNDLNTGEQFYLDVAAIDDEVLNHYFLKRQLQAGDFFTFLQRFRKHKYLFSYLDNNGLFYAMNRTLQRARQIPFAENLSAAFANEIIPEAEKILISQLEDFFKEMRMKLSY